jgi:hypothetical protein
MRSATLICSSLWSLLRLSSTELVIRPPWAVRITILVSSNICNTPRRKHDASSLLPFLHILSLLPIFSSSIVWGVERVLSRHVVSKHHRVEPNHDACEDRRRRSTNRVALKCNYIDDQIWQGWKIECFGFIFQIVRFWQFQTQTKEWARIGDLKIQGEFDHGKRRQGTEGPRTKKFKLKGWSHKNQMVQFWISEGPIFSKRIEFD